MTVLRQRMLQDMELIGLSPRTCRAYLRSVRQLAHHYGQSPDLLSEAQVRDYLSHLRQGKHFAPGSLKIAYSGIKFFFSRTVARKWPTLAGLRVPPEKKLPDVLTVEETQLLLGAPRTEHSRVCLWTIDSLGLRLSEGLGLQVADIDSARGLVHVHHGKGAVDRYVPLPQATLELLRRYWRAHRNPRWLFPALGRGRNAGHSATEPMPVSPLCQ